MITSIKPAIFVLVAGAFHGGWCWERVKPKLEARGHLVLAPDLLGMGDDKTPLAQVSLAAWTDQIATLINTQAEPVILVGHSRGGIIISEVAERVPERIRSLVYLPAFLVPPGETLAAVNAQQLNSELAPAIIEPGEAGTITIKPEAIAPFFYNTTHPDWQARAISLVGPEPMAAGSTPLQLTNTRYGSVPRAYIEALQDCAISIALQRAMQKALPCNPVVTLDTDHSPFYSDPEAVTTALEQIAHAAQKS